MDPVNLRHLLHQNPELAFNEYKTQEILENALKELGITPIKIAKTGLIVYLERDRTKPSILYRADIDALPIKEQTGCEFSSTNNYMHACGHDVHMSVLYGVIKKIVEENVPGNYVFVFQPAEETIGGAKYVIDEMRERYKVKYAFALHVTDEYELGEVATTVGTLFASAMEISAVFKGLSAHIAFREKGIDALKNSVLFLNEYYGFEFPEGYIAGFGKMGAGNVRNAVADLSIVEGSIRGRTIDGVVEIFNKLNELAKKYSGELQRGGFYPPVVVDEKLYSIFKEYIESTSFRFIDCGMKYTGEDFGFFSLKYPSLMYWAGVRLPGQEKVGLHNEKFLPSDDVLEPLVNLNVGWLNYLWNLI